jgi:hypothetical protein
MMFGRTVVMCAVLSTVLGCRQEPTGVHVYAHLADIPYDELRFSVADVPAADSQESPRIIVDPETLGRYQGPFNGGDQDVVIYLTDDVADQLIHCEAIALAQGAAIANGSADVVAPSQKITDIDIYLSLSPPGTPERGGAPPPSPPTSTGNTPGSDTTTVSVPGGPSGSQAIAGGNNSGAAPSTNGTACKHDSECASGHCSDDVCCDVDCAGACRSCRLAGSEGSCRNIPAGMQDGGDGNSGGGHSKPKAPGGCDMSKP